MVVCRHHKDKYIFSLSGTVYMKSMRTLTRFRELNYLEI